MIRSKRGDRKITIVLDLNSKVDYIDMFSQVKDLSMSEKKYHYILTYLVRKVAGDCL